MHIFIGLCNPNKLYLTNHAVTLTSSHWIMVIILCANPFPHSSRIIFWTKSPNLSLSLIFLQLRKLINSFSFRCWLEQKGFTLPTTRFRQVGQKDASKARWLGTIEYSWGLIYRGLNKETLLLPLTTQREVCLSKPRSKVATKMSPPYAATKPTSLSATIAARYLPSTTLK